MHFIRFPQNIIFSKTLLSGQKIPKTFFILVLWRAWGNIFKGGFLFNETSQKSQGESGLEDSGNSIQPYHSKISSSYLCTHSERWEGLHNLFLTGNYHHKKNVTGIHLFLFFKYAPYMVKSKYNYVKFTHRKLTQQFAQGPHWSVFIEMCLKQNQKEV